MKVLIADDSPTTRFALRKWLKEWGCDVLEAGNGEEAWRLLNEVDPPRIAILDWIMPGLDGVEICRRLQAREAGLFVYTILLTAKTEQQDLVYALENGAHNFQSKPISPEELRSYINVGMRLVAADDKIKEYAAQLEVLAVTDSLTGVCNRRSFMERGQKELKRARRHAHPLSVLLIDIDHFKAINDTHGHHAGDEALRAMARICLDELRDSDLFGRIGGEEFAVILPETDGDRALQVAERLRRSVERLAVMVAPGPVRITVSIGVATVRPGETVTLDEMLRRADLGLYRAKQNGRNCVVTV